MGIESEKFKAPNKDDFKEILKWLNNPKNEYSTDISYLEKGTLRQS